jgi:hypothetical protein
MSTNYEVSHSNPWTGIGIRLLCWTQQDRYFHLKMGAEVAPVTQCIRFRTLNDESNAQNSHTECKSTLTNFQLTPCSLPIELFTTVEQSLQYYDRNPSYGSSIHDISERISTRHVKILTTSLFTFIWSRVSIL